MPAVNISENEQNYHVKVAAPGLKKEDFKISLEDEMLTISTSNKEEHSEKDERFTRREFSFSSFSRSFNLPDNINKDAIQASYENGIMNIVIPKKEPAKPKSREISIA
jgi:HSP20 family protein